MEIIQLYRDFNRTVRTSDLSLLVIILPHRPAIFFAFNQPNYALWLVRYHDNLLSTTQLTIGVTYIIVDLYTYLFLVTFLFFIFIFNSGLVDGLIKGFLSVRRTYKPFSATSVDLTVQQTINLNCTSRKTVFKKTFKNENLR